MAWFRETLWYSVRSCLLFLPPIMIANKLLRGNFMGVPTENDVILFMFVKPPPATVPKNYDGFAPDVMARSNAEGPAASPIGSSLAAPPSSKP